ncbi:MAG: response regulator [Candidatus Viridilinea halotolerans]|uniref:Response regulator n=1 Tax=Candidatus Viridilinea halotolerans TaxID=2491704 RepID=A0A426UBH4_9CHLR|nr:MAG: response regulator [Candidatus Viridilinea halotolerans]
MNPPAPTHVLLVDDEPAVRLTLATLLKRRGFHVTTAEDGNEGLAKLADGPYAICIIDLHLPGIDGLTLARRARERIPNQPILILTGSGVSTEDDLSAALAPFPVLMKSTNPAEVLDRVAALCAGED